MPKTSVEAVKDFEEDFELSTIYSNDQSNDPRGQTEERWANICLVRSDKCLWLHSTWPHLASAQSSVSFTTNWQGLQKGIPTVVYHVVPSLQPSLSWAWITVITITNNNNSSRRHNQRPCTSIRHHPAGAAEFNGRPNNNGVACPATWARLSFKARKSRRLVIKKGRVTSKFGLKAVIFGISQV